MNVKTTNVSENWFTIDPSGYRKLRCPKCGAEEVRNEYWIPTPRDGMLLLLGNPCLECLRRFVHENVPLLEEVDKEISDVAARTEE